MEQSNAQWYIVLPFIVPPQEVYHSDSRLRHIENISDERCNLFLLYSKTLYHTTGGKTDGGLSWRLLVTVAGPLLIFPSFGSTILLSRFFELPHDSARFPCLFSSVSSLQLLSRLLIAPSQCLQSLEQCIRRLNLCYVLVDTSVQVGCITHQRFTKSKGAGRYSWKWASGSG